jgi:hypothetical protein
MCFFVKIIIYKFNIKQSRLLIQLNIFFNNIIKLFYFILNIKIIIIYQLNPNQTE